jgi:phage gp36-like protein
VSQYATKTDLEQLALPSRALEDSVDADLTAALVAASSEADSYLEARYTLPLLTWPAVLRLMVAKIAAYHIQAGKGFQPDADPERPDPIVKGYEDAIAWLEKIHDGEASLPSAETTETSSSTSAGGAPDADSDEPRGF